MSIFQRFWDWIRGKKLRFSFPPEVEAAGRHAMAYARGAVRPTVKVPSDLGGNLYLVEAAAIVSGLPVFHHAAWPGWYIAGLCQDKGGGKVAITVAHRRGNRAAVDAGTIRHEFGHGWLFQRKIYGHDPRFDAAFAGWAETRRATGVTVGGREPPPVPTHIDIVAAPVMAGADGGTANA